MRDVRSPYEIEPPSGKRLLTSTTAALLFALIVLVTLVLPAEYGVDPTGIGDVLGLVSLSEEADGLGQTEVETSATTAATQSAGNNRGFFIEEMVASKEYLPEGLLKPAALPNPAVHQHDDQKFKTKLIEFELLRDQRVEYKAQLEQGRVILYSWTMTGGKLHYDYHAEPYKGPKGYWVRYKAADGEMSDHGSLVAPFSGQHGWYFHNIGDTPLTIRLEISGFYDGIVRLGL